MIQIGDYVDIFFESSPSILDALVISIPREDVPYWELETWGFNIEYAVQTYTYMRKLTIEEVRNRHAKEEVPF